MSGNLLEQKEELEALESIFPDCFKKITSKPPYQYKIQILPNVEGCGVNHGKLFCYISVGEV